MEKKSVHYEKIVAHHLRYFITVGLLSHRAVDWDEANLTFFRKALHSRWPAMIFSTNMFILSTMYLGNGVRILLTSELDHYFICEMILIQGVTLRYCLLRLKRRDLLRLVDACRRLWRRLSADEAEIVRRFERKAYYLRCFFVGNCVISVSFHLAAALIIRLPPKEVNGTEGRILPFKFYVEVENDPWYTLVATLQMLVCCHTVVIFGGTDTVNPFLIMISCGYLKVIQKRLYSVRDDQLTMADGTSSKSLNRSLVRDCVRFHQDVVAFCNEVIRFADSIFLVQIISTVYNAALIGLKILERDPELLIQVSVLVLSMMQFFTCQWIPQHLLDESGAIADAAYAATLTHRRYDRTANQMLQFTILRAQRPLQMKAGAFFNLSLETFKQMMTSAFSFFMVLRNSS